MPSTTTLARTIACVIARAAPACLALALMALVAGMSTAGVAAAAGAEPASRYIVTLREASPPGPVNADRSPEVNAIANDLVMRHGGTIDFVYGSALYGFAATMTPSQARAMEGDPRVAAMEPDAVIRIPPRPRR